MSTTYYPRPLDIKALETELDPDEEVRWHGTPDVKEYVFANLIPGIMIAGVSSLLSMLFLLFGANNLAQALNWWAPSRVPAPTIAGAAAECAIGIGLLVVTWGAVVCVAYHYRRRAARTIYALTNTRLITILTSDGTPVDVHSIEPAHPLILKRIDSANGLGCINLFPSSNGVSSFSWYGVSEPRRVEHLIRHTFDPPHLTSSPHAAQHNHPETSQ
ncbi:MAG: hypothetical protein KF859_06680 [Phycisphaeraceae bacterium]|nr:hypothetical protein [Phycisphaeraceae bacterium]